MKLVHFTGAPLRHGVPASARRIAQRQRGDKPRGFWVSDEDEFGWLEWSKAEHFRLENFAHAYEVKLVDEPNILYLRSVEDIDLFTTTYGVIEDWQRKFMPPKDDVDRLITDRYHRIDWERLRALFNGIIITPYQWERRLTNEAAWYYSWDCASGVIWNTGAAIASLKEIDPPDLNEAFAEKVARDAEHAKYLADNGWADDSEMMRAVTQKMSDGTLFKPDDAAK